MAIEHKAWLFDYRRFDREMAGILYRALESDEIGELAAFIDQHRTTMTNQWTEEPLDADWRDGIECMDAPSLGDEALTRYYHFTAEIGLGYGCDAVLAYLKS